MVVNSILLGAEQFSPLIIIFDFSLFLIPSVHPFRKLCCLSNANIFRIPSDFATFTVNHHDPRHHHCVVVAVTILLGLLKKKKKKISVPGHSSSSLSIWWSLYNLPNTMSLISSFLFSQHLFHYNVCWPLWFDYFWCCCWFCLRCFSSWLFKLKLTYFIWMARLFSPLSFAIMCSLFLVLQVHQSPLLQSWIPFPDSPTW